MEDKDNKTLKAVYDIFLSVPGMSDNVSVNLKVSRKNILLLVQLLKGGLKTEGNDVALLAITGKETISEINTIAEDLLQKAGLVELNAKIALMRGS